MLQTNPTGLDLLRYGKSQLRKHKRKQAKKAKLYSIVEKELKLGEFYHVKTMTGLVPYNAKGRTFYLIEGGLTCIGEKTKSGFRIYLCGGRIANSRTELLNLVKNGKIPKPVIARRYELKVGNQLVMGE